jgi:hypothetical protein
MVGGNPPMLTAMRISDEVGLTDRCATTEIVSS